MDLISKVLLLGVALLAALLLFTPYESFLEGVVAGGMVLVVLVGFLIYPCREVFYVRTTVRLVDPDRNPTLEHDLLAVRVELARLWLLFLPTALAVAFLVFFAVGGAMKFSVLDWTFSHHYILVVASAWVLQLPPLLVIVLLSAWISERRVLRNAEACSARSFSVSLRTLSELVEFPTCLWGNTAKYYGGDCLHFGSVLPNELATIVFHNVRKPELNKIAMGFLFHRLIVLGRGVADLDEQTTAAQAVLAEMGARS